MFAVALAVPVNIGIWILGIRPYLWHIGKRPSPLMNWYCLSWPDFQVCYEVARSARRPGAILLSWGFLLSAAFPWFALLFVFCAGL